MDIVHFVDKNYRTIQKKESHCHRWVCRWVVSRQCIFQGITQKHFDYVGLFFFFFFAAIMPH